MLKNLFGFLGDVKELAAPQDENKPSQQNKSQSTGQLSSPSKPRSSSKPKSSSQSSKETIVLPAVRESQPVKLLSGASFEETEVAIRAAYKQVFGNAHLMESQKLLSAESKFKDGQLTVKGFVRALAKSELYRSLFVEKSSNVRVVELNFKHLLGRAPESAQEVSQHIATLVNDGFDAEIDSYLDSDEYEQNFGKGTVPYYVSYTTQTGKNVAGYNRISQLVKGTSSSDLSVDASGRSQLQNDLLSKVVEPKPQPLAFVPKTLNVAKSLGAKPKSPKKQATPSSTKSKANTKRVDEAQIQIKIFPEDQAKTLADKYRDAFSGNAIIEMYGDSASQENLDIIIRAAYRQVFGNAHLMDSERSREAESQMRSGQINVSDFIRKLAKSDRYRSLFWDKYPAVTAIELNFKHLLGRAPESSDEVSQHLNILAEGGFEAEIDSYLDSDEYLQNFGTLQVPYPRGYNTQPGRNALGFTRAFPSFGPACSSDKSTFGSARPTLQAGLLTDVPSTIPALRPIPESFPEALSEVPTPRIPKEIRAIARELLQKRGGYESYRFNSPTFTQSAFANEN